MIVIEGPDGSGKTTLAEKLCEEYGLTYMRYEGLSSTEGPDGHGIVDWWWTHLECDADDTLDYVFDRSFFISEPIYQMAQRDRELIAPGEEMVRGIAALANQAHLVVFCNQDWSVQEKILSDTNRLALKGVDAHMLKKVSWLYHVFYGMWSESIFERCTYYDYTTMSGLSIDRAVQEVLKRG